MSRSINVSVIDILPLSGGDKDSKLRVADQIHSSCRGSGFFYISNHGVDVDEFHRMTSSLHQTMTYDEKWDLAINAYNKNNPHIRNGYYMAIEGKKAVESYCYLNPSFTKDHPMIKSGTPMHEVNIWPDSVKHPQIRPFFEKHYWNIFRLSELLLRGFALALGKDETFFDPYFQEKSTLSSVSLIRYPYLENYPPVKVGPDGTKLSFEDHLDVSIITVLYQTPISNLQVEMDDGFKDIPVSGDKFLVNCGTYMEYITNSYFHAPNHRVKYINQERLSLPFFVNLGYDSTIKPFFPNNPSRRYGNHEAISYGKYLQDELQALIIKNGQT